MCMKNEAKMLGDYSQEYLNLGCFGAGFTGEIRTRDERLNKTYKCVAS